MPTPVSLHLGLSLTYLSPSLSQFSPSILFLPQGSRMGPRGAALVLSRIVATGKKTGNGSQSKSHTGGGGGGGGGPGGPGGPGGGAEEGAGGGATPLLRSLSHVDLTDALIGAHTHAMSCEGRVSAVAYPCSPLLPHSASHVLALVPPLATSPCPHASRLSLNCTTSLSLCALMPGQRPSPWASPVPFLPVSQP